MSVEIIFEAEHCHIEEFDTPAQARFYLEQIQAAGGYWMSIRSIKTEIFTPWHTVTEVRIQPKGTRAKEEEEE